MYIGIDDTDSIKGMCTTYLALEIIQEFKDEFDLIGYPRLVRLNPNIPWKTRGNGAISLRLDEGVSSRTRIGMIGRSPVYSFDNIKNGKGSRPPVELEDVFDRVKGIVEGLAHINVKGTNSAIVITRKRPPRIFYEKAVRNVVAIKGARKGLPKGCCFKTYGNGRGLIGALSALAWTPNQRTYEVLAYRRKGRWGSKRKVDLNDVKRLDTSFPSTFNNYDPINDYAAIVPNTPCPILVGIRGLDPNVLPEALNSIGTEPKDRWVVFETNQGTDDHLIKRQIVKKYTSGILEAMVISDPLNIKGGHVLFDIRIKGSGKKYTCAAYEPTKEFRKIIRQLLPNDQVVLHGSRAASNPDTLNIEKIKIQVLSRPKIKVQNPKCPDCDAPMKSVGKGAGFKCRHCGRKAKEEDAVFKLKERNIKLGWYEVPVCARRHLSRPLSFSNLDPTFKITPKKGLFTDDNPCSKLTD